MKRLFIAATLVLLVSGGMTFAQGGGFQRRTVEERVQMVHAKMDSAFKLNASQLKDVDSVFANFYRATDKMREDLSSGGERPDFQAMREKNQPLIDDRDEKLKGIIGEADFKIWKETIEPSMRPRRQSNGFRQ
jgi:periplasmic protein CpxP/Spy